MTIFSDAEDEWKVFLSNKKWASSVLGDSFYVRFPIEIGTQEAQTYKRSLYLGDDSVHAWEASGVRQKIISRLIDSQDWTIRPCYGKLAFFAYQIRFLPPLTEHELDFVVRTSLMSDDSDIFSEARANLLSNLDPDLDQEEDTSSYLRDLHRPEDTAIRYARCQIELYGLLAVIQSKLFVLTDQEIKEVIDFLFDIETADKFLVRRFIQPNKDDNRPFIGEHNDHTKLKQNFLQKYIGGEDTAYYPYRVFHLFLRNLLSFDAQAVDRIEREKFDLVKDFTDIDELKKIIFHAIRFSQYYTLKENFKARLRTEYALQRTYNEYRSELIHLLKMQKKIFSGESEGFILSLIDKTIYHPQFFCMELGNTIIASMLKNLARQVPEPEGVGKIQSRLILNRRISNLEKSVLTDEVKKEILESFSLMFTRLDNEQEVENAFKVPYEKIAPRGEYFFKEMEEEVKQNLETGDLSLRKELMETTDTPQSLAKQYGRSLNLLDDDASISEVYSNILALKGTELVFGGGNLSVLQLRKVTESFVKDVFSPQFEFLKLLSPKTTDEEPEEKA
ncbi:MAG: hypothetical protein KAT16_04705 [Candidatus Heimdallarchaeota archaeon]|nr:hypothetical protein [Candidatus Heimdallarchaeota archaeon]